jgi:hypothetical protein
MKQWPTIFRGHDQRLYSGPPGGNCCSAFDSFWM